jgi:hypothetical protein
MMEKMFHLEDLDASREVLVGQLRSRIVRGAATAPVATGREEKRYLAVAG